MTLTELFYEHGGDESHVLMESLITKKKGCLFVAILLLSSSWPGRTGCLGRTDSKSAVETSQVCVRCTCAGFGSSDKKPGEERVGIQQQQGADPRNAIHSTCGLPAHAQPSTQHENAQPLEQFSRKDGQRACQYLIVDHSSFFVGCKLKREDNITETGDHNRRKTT